MTTVAAERDGGRAERHRREAGEERRRKCIRAGRQRRLVAQGVGDGHVRSSGRDDAGPWRLCPPVSSVNEIRSLFVTAPVSISPSARLLGDTIASAITASST